MKTNKFGLVWYLALCFALVFGLIGGLSGSRVALAAQENSGVSAPLPPGEEEPPPEEPQERVDIYCNWPVLEGQPGDSFEFEIKFDYRINERRTFELGLTVPPGWTGSPLSGYPEREIEAFEADPESITETLSVQVASQEGTRTEPGEYTFTFEVVSGELRDSVELKAVVVPRPLQYSLDVVTLSGITEVRVKAGEGAHTTIYVRNVNTGAVSNLSLTAEHPEGWQVSFTPGDLGTLESGLFTEVDVVITPPADVETGDYPVIVNAIGDEAEESLELRTTVTGTTTLAGVGIGVGVGVIAGLIIWFRRAGRR